LAAHGDGTNTAGYRTKIRRYTLGVFGLFGNISNILLIYSTTAGADP
jgi:hypothetical protein